MSSEVLSYNSTPLQDLERALALQGERFALILARCNYQRLQNTLLEHLSRQHPQMQVLSLPQRIPSLLDAIQIHLRLAPAHPPSPSALMVTGLGQVEHLEAILKAANLARDTYREQLPFPLVLWIDDHLLAHLTQLAQDLKNLGPPTIRFEFPPEELISGLHREAEALFNRLLEIPSEPNFSDPLIDISNSDRLSNELTFALADLKRQRRSLGPDLQASLEFARGRQAHSRLEMETAKVLYEASLAHWQLQTEQGHPQLIKQALLQFHLGLWWRSYAALQRSTYVSSLQQARLWFEDALDSFNQTGQPQLVARFIHPLCEVLQKQRDWTNLTPLTQEALALHEQCQDLVRQARDHGFLAEIALQDQAWNTAQNEAQRALDLLEAAAAQLQATPHDVPLATALTIARRFQKSWYRFLLGEAQMHLASPETAIALLESARQEADPQADLTLYLQILTDLIHHYFSLGKYRQAFNIKLELRQVEYANNLRAFIGAGAVQIHPQTRTTIANEITASGRYQDVEALVRRLQQKKTTLIVIHGPSGVGKSSILNAGLAPAIGRITPEGRTTIPIVVQTYGSWRQTIIAALQEQGLHLTAEPSSTEALGCLAAATDCQRFIVLLFDQFEEFFFDRNLEERREFYAFIEACLNLPWVKVILALREDYLHHLLELENYTQITAEGAVLKDGGVLSNDVRYPLGNFTAAAAEAVIRRLTEAAQYYLEESLIHQLVEDLAADTDTGTVRPIELQVVGAQLQRENIATLAQYQQLGNLPNVSPKIRLVQRYLAYVVRDCGPPNEKLAQLMLYLLTEEDEDKRLYRPLKTREDLEYELSLLNADFTAPQLDLVLYILVGSGLVFAVPEEPDDRYQLVHDYLAPFVRDEQAPELLAELSQAQKRQRQAEENERLARMEAERLSEANAVLEEANAEAKAVVSQAQRRAGVIGMVVTAGVILAIILISILGSMARNASATLG